MAFCLTVEGGRDGAAAGGVKTLSDGKGLSYREEEVEDGGKADGVMSAEGVGDGQDLPRPGVPWERGQEV